MGFTFYGDLLSISSLYKLSAEVAYEKLNSFYNTTFFSLDPKWETDNNIRTYMFSDSLLITGDGSVEATLEQLMHVYVKLLHKGILLRGAIVSGSLSLDPRVTRNNFEKFLPQNDTLARAAGLEGTHKGSRLLIETDLARNVLSKEKDWLTHEGYIKNIKGDTNLDYESILRRISPTPDGSCYELLYFWVNNSELNHTKADYKKKRDEINEIKKMVREDLGVHYKETSDLLTRCESRHSYTDKYFNPRFPLAD